MPYVIKAIGVLLLVAGVLFAALPPLMDRVVMFAKVGKRVYIGGVIRVLVGVTLLVGSLEAASFWIPVVIGSLFTLTGITIFIIGTERTHALMDWWMSLPEGRRRVSPIIVAVAGVLLVYAA